MTQNVAAHISRAFVSNMGTPRARWPKPTIVSDKLRRTWPAVVKWEEGKNGGQVG